MANPSPQLDTQVKSQLHQFFECDREHVLTLSGLNSSAINGGASASLQDTQMGEN